MLFTPLISFHLMKKVLIPAIALLWIATSCLAQQVIYVKADAQGTGSGLNWANAMPDLQTALAQATYGTEIRIASGMYRPTNGTNRDSTFSLKNGYRLRGGFAGTGPTPDIQNPDVYATILSGDIGMPGDSSDNSYSVMTSSGNMDETTLLEGLILEAGAATSTDPNDLWLSPRKAGGGFYCRTGSINRLRIKQCIFRRNLAIIGAHVFIFQPNGQSSLRVENSQFLDGIGGSGLHVVVDSPDSIVISHCAFLRHRSFPGFGAIVLFVSPYNMIKKLVLEYSQFRDCEVGDLLGPNTLMAGIAGDTAVMRHCMFLNNIHSGGDLFSMGGTRVNFLDQDTFLSNRVVNQLGNLLSSNGSFLFSSLEQQIKNCTFEQNEETHLFRSFYSANISRCVFRDNILERGLFLDQVTSEYAKLTTVEHNIFERNTYKSLVDFETSQGSLYPADNKGWVFNQNLIRENTGLLFDTRKHQFTIHTSTASWNYCTFSDNHFPSGQTGDTLPYLFDLRNIDLATFNSCAFDQPLQDSLKLFYDSLSIVQLRNNVFLADSCSQTYQFGNASLCDSSNFWGVSPIFEDKAAENFRLSGCSPGINKGDFQLATQLGLSTDLNYSSRVENGLPDIGAFENKLFLQGSVAEYSCVKPASGTLFFDGNTCGPYTYEWWNGMESGTSNMDLPSSKYEVSVTDLHGIVYLDTIFLPEFVPVVIDTILQNPTSITAQDGSIAVPNVFNGLPPFHFNWSTGDSTSVIDGLGVGPYILTITDQLGCQITFLFQLTAPTIGTQNIIEEKPLIYLIPNLLSKASSSRLLCPEGFSEVMIVDALGRVVLSEQVDGTEFMLPAMGYGGIFWVFARDSESANWLKPLRLVAF
jgi:hypothetical protein